MHFAAMFAMIAGVSLMLASVSHASDKKPSLSKRLGNTVINKIRSNDHKESQIVEPLVQSIAEPVFAEINSNQATEQIVSLLRRNSDFGVDNSVLSCLRYAVGPWVCHQYGPSNVMVPIKNANHIYNALQLQLAHLPYSHEISIERYKKSADVQNAPFELEVTDVKRRGVIAVRLQLRTPV